MTDARRIFVDTNVLTKATIDAAPLHDEARARLDMLWEEGTELYISQQVIREYMVNATRPQVYSPPLPMNEVVEQIEDFRKSFYILSDSPAVLIQLLHIVRKVTVSGKPVHDANIVATMLANDIDELLTHNVKDFERYKAYIHVIPLIEETQ